MSAKKTISRVEGLELIMERSFDAPKERVYSMFIEPDHIVRWWGPNGWETTVYKMEVKPGGVWHYCMRSPEGQEAWGKSIYREVDPPDRLVYVDAFSDEQGNEVTGMPVMLITLDFSSEGPGSKVISRTAFETQEELQKIIDMQAVEGMTETYDRLDNYLKEQQQS
ncbi:SRPBCC family protein [Planococcus salinus]|uniref:SRPBCC domain-containing protein n=1 Tax=Planococcus salinus TaxID=1848460 RepID=A0A3M8P5Q2_9BACL|nr:SRPBCC domain-containing protein [Planococcus salinus]RNF38985.1 SRPBCC domain-containing protein [Planococcus salinus]